MIFKSKNDSHQLYLIMTSMQRDRPKVMTADGGKYTEKEKHRLALVEKFS